MATTNEIFVVYVNADKTLFPARVYADNADVLSDDRDLILIKFRRSDGQGGYFEDEYSGWPAFNIHRFVGKDSKASGATITRSRAKDGPTPAEARDVHYDDDNKPGRQKVWPAKLNQAAVGGSGARLASYDLDASDYETILVAAQALNPGDTPITP